MKKWISRLLTLCLAAVLALSLLPLRAEAAGASFSGSSSLRAGDSVTVTFSVSGSGIVAIQGTLSYDSSVLELRDTSCLLGGGWTMDMNGNTVVLYDSSLSSPISSSSVFSVTFRVKDSVSSGTTVSASVGGISVSDGNSDTSLGSASWSATIAAPLSGNANLASLTCGNATLSPAFSAGTTSYSCTVPYSVTWLDLHYSVADSGASAWVSGNDLSVGENTVSVGVEAANGSVKYYNIYVTRQQDPNYKPSTNAKLESLSPSTGRLSPAFRPDVMDYVIYLPFEADSISLSGVAQDGKALSVTDASAQLEPGDNQLTVVCTAEDGKTTETYTVHVYRMPAYAGVLPEIISPDGADYSAVDQALEKVPLDLSDYTAESVTALKTAIGAVVRNLPKEEQGKVDAMAKAIQDALDALEEKPAPVVLTPWEKLVETLGEEVNIPLLGKLTGPLPLKYLALAALILLALLIYLIGTLVGRHAGKRKALRALAAASEDGGGPDDDGPDGGGPDGDGPDGGEPPTEEPPVVAAPVEEPPIAEEPGTVAEPPVVEEPPVLEESPVIEEAPVIEESPVIEEPSVVEEPPVVFAAEEPPAEEVTRDLPEEPDEAPEIPAGESARRADDILGRMTLDELLEDIRNM